MAASPAKSCQTAPTTQFQPFEAGKAGLETGRMASDPLADIQFWGDDQRMTWPTLPTVGFIVNRPATVDDVDRGNAVFCQQADDGEPSEPFDVEIPQYAIWHEDDDGNVPAILVQAEHHITDPDGEPVFGLRTLDGREVVATSGEVSLLSKQAPTA